MNWYFIVWMQNTALWSLRPKCDLDIELNVNDSCTQQIVSMRMTKNLKIPSEVEELQSKHKILLRDLWAHSATLTLNHGQCLLGSPHCFNTVNISECYTCIENPCMCGSATNDTQILWRMDWQTADIQGKNNMSPPVWGWGRQNFSNRLAHYECWWHVSILFCFC